MTSVDVEDFLIGIYRHYKGPSYLVLGLAHDANAEGRIAVVYVGLMLDGAHTGPRLAVRSYDDFLAYVCTTETCPGYGNIIEDDDTGVVCAICENIGRRRFAYVGQIWTG